MPELVVCSHSSLPFFASNARNLRSLVPPTKTRSPAVANTDANNCERGKSCCHTFLPVDKSQACNSPQCVAPGRIKRMLSSGLVPSHSSPGTKGTSCPLYLPQNPS